MAITKRQRQVYDFIADFVQKNQYSPSFEEIGDGLGLSSLATVNVGEHRHGVAIGGQNCRWPADRSD